MTTKRGKVASTPADESPPSKSKRVRPSRERVVSDGPGRVHVIVDGRTPERLRADKQSSVLHALETNKASILEAKSGLILLGAIRECAKAGAALPCWLADEYCRRFDAVLSFHVKTFDEAFGRPFPKGVNITAVSKRREDSFAVYFEVSRRHRDQSARLDDDLFEKVGKQFDIGKTLAKEIYYEMKGKAVTKK